MFGAALGVSPFAWLKGSKDPCRGLESLNFSTVRRVFLSVPLTGPELSGWRAGGRGHLAAAFLLLVASVSRGAHM